MDLDFIEQLVDFQKTPEEVKTSKYGDSGIPSCLSITF